LNDDLAGKMCSPEEIEKKRLLALQKRQSKQAQLMKLNVPTSSSVSGSNGQLFQELKHTHVMDTNIMRQNKSNNRFNPIEPKKFFTQASTVTGKCYMISNNRFALETSAFVPEIIATFKTIPSRVYGNYKLNDFNVVYIHKYLKFLFMFMYFLRCKIKNMEFSSQ